MFVGLPFMFFFIKVAICGSQFLFLLKQQGIFFIDLKEHRHFGTKYFGIDWLKNIVNTSGLVPFEDILISIIIGSNENNGNVPQLLAFINQRSRFKTAQYGHLYVHEDHSKVKLVEQNF